ncbi:protein kinase [Streptomyces sp. SID3343]|uniref:protein kinase domain-containing protein n=1 Tax=Streptomyces sp. SID3343 TaxID=2690260 RepID=UPI00136A32C6|nr:protein kinase [Streptomyces sp. SID3343]MYW05338.1 protein kinase [Streptomyces sp. SID3343]
MNGMFTSGHTLTDADGQPITVRDFLGGGGQGEVYRVDSTAGERALKWYFPSADAALQRHIVLDLIERGSPDDRFLWPQTLVENTDGFGYLMDVRGARFVGLPDLLSRRVAAGYPALLTACVNLVEAYRRLHAAGVAYRDISWGNVFLDPRSGDVLVCDNDNAVADGQRVTITGTMDFMAPELVRADPDAQPCTQTDLHALAVLLFMILMNHHPLCGRLELQIRCLDGQAKTKLFGRDPVFVFDPKDDRNRPLPGEQDTVIHTWSAAPAGLRALFESVFTVGLGSPNDRVREGQWRDMLSRLVDLVMPCQGCGRANMTDVSSPGNGTCWKCRGALRSPVRLEVTVPGTGSRAPRTILMTPGAKLYEHHRESDPKRHDFTAVVAEVTEHPTRAGVFGLTNRTASDFTVRRPDGSTDVVGPGRSIAIKPGISLRQDTMEGRFVG